MEPAPGVKAKLWYYVLDLEKVRGLSDLEIRKRYETAKSEIKTLTRTFDETDERNSDFISILEGVTRKKREVVMYYDVMSRRGLLAAQDGPEVFSLVLREPSVATGVSVNAPPTLPPTNDRRPVIDAMRGLADSLGEKAPDRQLVFDGQTGLALGFLEAEPVEKLLEINPGQTRVVKRRFVRALDQGFPSETGVHVIAMSIEPSGFRDGGLSFKEPLTQVIARNGQLMNVEWTCQFQVEKGFSEQEFFLAARLLSYDSEEAYRAGRESSADSLRVPLSAMTLKKRESGITLKGTMEFLKELFGVVGGFPTAALAIMGVSKYYRKARRGLVRIAERRRKKSAGKKEAKLRSSAPRDQTLRARPTSPVKRRWPTLRRSKDRDEGR